MAAWKSGWGSSRRGGGAVPVPIPVPNPIPGAPILPRAQNNLVCLFFFFPLSHSSDSWDLQRPRAIAFRGLRGPQTPHSHPSFPSHPSQGCSPSPRALYLPSSSSPGARRKATPSLSSSDGWSGPAAPHPQLRPCYFLERPCICPQRLFKQTFPSWKGKGNLQDADRKSGCSVSAGRAPAAISVPGG